MRFPGVRVAEGDAVKLREYTLRDGVKEITAIVSGLPLRLLDQEARASLLRRSFDCMADSGFLVQFTYSHRPPLPPPLIGRLGLEARRVGLIWRNLPPASVWEFRRPTLQMLPLRDAEELRSGGDAAPSILSSAPSRSSRDALV
jgi:phosphatidylethanolamine/phosphatidyl-N-methylethanolamine N-methyltransferase